MTNHLIHQGLTQEQVYLGQQVRATLEGSLSGPGQAQLPSAGPSFMSGTSSRRTRSVEVPTCPGPFSTRPLTLRQSGQITLPVARGFPARRGNMRRCRLSVYATSLPPDSTGQSTSGVALSPRTEKGGRAAKNFQPHPQSNTARG